MQISLTRSNVIPLTNTSFVSKKFTFKLVSLSTFFQSFNGSFLCYHISGFVSTYFFFLNNNFLAVTRSLSLVEGSILLTVVINTECCQVEFNLMISKVSTLLFYILFFWTESSAYLLQ